MIRHTQKLMVQVPRLHFYETVKQVEKYREFVPFCSQSRVARREGSSYFEGELEIDFRFYKSAYVSKVFLDDRSITSVSENNSVFKRLESVWEIDGNEDECQVHYKIEFQFQNLLYQQVSQFFLDEVVNKTAEAFRQRALLTYSLQTQLKDTPILDHLLRKNLIDQAQHNKVVKNKILIQQLETLRQQIKDRDLQERLSAQFIIDFILHNPY